MTKHFALVVEWQLPDDADHETTLLAMVNLIRANSPRIADNVTAYVDVSAELIAEAARTGAIVSQATRLQLAPGDVVTIRPRTDFGPLSMQELDDYRRLAKIAFPDHQVVVLEGDATIEAGPPS